MSWAGYHMLGTQVNKIGKTLAFIWASDRRQWVNISAAKKMRAWGRACVWGFHPSDPGSDCLLSIFSPSPLGTQSPVSPPGRLKRSLVGTIWFIPSWSPEFWFPVVLGAAGRCLPFSKRGFCTCRVSCHCWAVWSLVRFFEGCLTFYKYTIFIFKTEFIRIC